MIERMSPDEVAKLLAKQSKSSKFGVDNSDAGKLNRTFNGFIYASEFEASIAAELELKKRAKLIRDWMRQVSVPLVINGIQVGKMIIDFKIFHNDNSIEYLECKGYGTPLWKLQRKVFEALNRGVRYTVRRERE